MRIPRSATAALALLGALVLAPRELRAASCTWDDSSNDWSASTSHWSCGAIPGAGDDVIGPAHSLEEKP